MTLNVTKDASNTAYTPNRISFKMAVTVKACAEANGLRFAWQGKDVDDVTGRADYHIAFGDDDDITPEFCSEIIAAWKNKA